MFLDFVQVVRRPSRGFTAAFKHLGALGLFFLAILDSMPLPTFGGPDILTVILVVAKRGPWYEYAALAASGSVIGAYITFRLARRAGLAYLENKFGPGRVPTLLRFFEQWGTGALIASTAIPFPFPTSVFFAAAGASNYRTRKYLGVVAVSRAARYLAIAYTADRYGRHLVRVFRHPIQYWGWLLVLTAVVLAIIIAGIIVNKRLAAPSTTPWQPRQVPS